MPTKVFEDKKNRISVEWIPGGKRQVIIEVAPTNDRMGAPQFRDAQTPEERLQAFEAFTLAEYDRQQREAAERCPRGGPGDL